MKHSFLKSLEEFENKGFIFSDFAQKNEKSERVSEEREPNAKAQSSLSRAEKDRYPHPPVFFVRVANKGLMLDAASRSSNKRTKDRESTCEDWRSGVGIAANKGVVLVRKRVFFNSEVTENAEGGARREV